MRRSCSFRAFGSRVVAYLFMGVFRNEAKVMFTGSNDGTIVLWTSTGTVHQKLTVHAAWRFRRLVLQSFFLAWCACLFVGVAAEEGATHCWLEWVHSSLRNHRM